MSTLEELLSEQASIENKVKANEESIRHLTKANGWHKKHLRLLEAQIEEANVPRGTSAEALQDISDNLK